MDELGSPEQVAKQIIKELAVKKIEEKGASPMRLSMIWIVLLALFVAPIGFPFSFIFVLAILCIFILLAFLFLAFFICSVVCVFSGIISLAAGCVLLFSQPANGISVPGFSFILVGCGILWFYANWAAVKAF